MYLGKVEFSLTSRPSRGVPSSSGHTQTVIRRGIAYIVASALGVTHSQDSATSSHKQKTHARTRRRATMTEKRTNCEPARHTNRNESCFSNGSSIGSPIVPREGASLVKRTCRGRCRGREETLWWVRMHDLLCVSARI